MTSSSESGIRSRTFSTSTWNSSSLNRSCSSWSFQSVASRSSRARGSGTSRFSSTSNREIFTRWSCSGSANGCFTWIRGTIGLASISALSEPYFSSKVAAVLSPTPRIPGMLSLVSPTSARKSGISSGGTPIFLMTSSRV